MGIERVVSPHTLTVLCTYQCTAACKQCCFESGPRVMGRLSRETIIARIAEAKRTFPRLTLVAFSGGEAMMLKDDLHAAIAFATAEGLTTRVVSNGYWGKTPQSARTAVKKLIQAGLCELNISTGRDHQEWVPAASVANAAAAAAADGLFCLITVESDGEDRSLLDELLKHPLLSAHIESRAVTIQSNSWMPFHDSAESREQRIDVQEIRKGCDQIFGTTVVTPHDNLSACCGLTLEHIPEMRLGKNTGSNMEALYSSQFEDFMKVWLQVDGPYTIVERLMETSAEQYLKNVVHICEACVILHKNPEVRATVMERYQEFIPEITTRFKIAMALRERADTTPTT